MEWQPIRVSVIPGDGVVARQGQAIVVADPQGSEQEQFVDDLLALCSSKRANEHTADESLVRQVAALVTQRPAAAVPSFGLVTTTTLGTVALVAGGTEVSVTGLDGTVVTLNGRDAVTYVDRVLGAGFRQILMTTGVSAATPDRRSNLSGGVVRGAGVLLLTDAEPAVPATAPVPMAHANAPATEEPATEEPPTEEARSAAEPASDPVATGEGIAADNAAPTDGAAGGPTQEMIREVRANEPSFAPIDLFGPDDSVGPEPATEPAPGEREHLVQGIVCSRGHFNRPEAKFCARCGISMVHQTHNLVTGVRPPLGVLVLDDGSVFALTSDYVVGREPEISDDVTSAAAVALALDDPELAMSRAHAKVLLDGWEVRIEDAHSANGTFVLGPSDADWTRLESGVPTTIQPGARVSIGGRTFTFESHQRN